MLNSTKAEDLDYHHLRSSAFLYEENMMFF